MARRVLLVLAGVIGGLLVLALVAVLVVTQTDWGRERVRRYVVQTLNDRANGKVSIGRASGNLLTGVTLDSVVIVDSVGRPFLRAERVVVRYSLPALLRKRIVVSELRLVHPDIVLDKRPGEEWNYLRIFPTDTTQKTPDQRGFGSWITFRDVAIVGGHLQLRSPWSPPDSLAPAERREATRDALAGRTRMRVEAVPGGYQSLTDLYALNAQLPLLRLADPDSANILVKVASLNTRAALFQPPLAEVRDLAGTFRIGSDSLHLADLRARLPSTRVAGEGYFAYTTQDWSVALRADTLALADLRWLYPPLPERGGGSFASAALARHGASTDVAARGIDLRVGEATLAGSLGLTMGDTLQLRDTDLRFAKVDTRLIQRFAPELELPREGSLDGHLVLAGDPGALRLDGTVAFTDPATGTSRVRADGVVGNRSGLQVRNLRLAFDPVRLDLVRAFAPQLPLRGTLVGQATLDGAYPGTLRVDGDVTVRDPRAGASRITAAGGVTTGEELAFRDLRVGFDPVQMSLVRTLRPDLPLQGTLTGSASLDGTLRALALNGDLTLRDPRTGTSRVRATGRVATGPELRVSNLRLAFDPVQLELARLFSPDFPLHGAVTGRASLSGTLRALALNTDLTLHDPETGISRVRAAGEVGTTEQGARMDNLRIALEPVQLGLVSAFTPDASLSGTLSGRATLSGLYPGLLEVDGDLRVAEQRSGTSRVLANGGVVVGKKVRFERLRLRFDPFQVELVRTVKRDFPLGGTLSGTATLNGTPGARFSALADLVHVEGGDRSHITGRATLASGAGGPVDVDVRLLPLSLDVAGRFAPAAQLQGSARGQVRARGTMRDLALNADLDFSPGGSLAIAGSFQRPGSEPAYDFDATFTGFDAGGVTRRAPHTALTGLVSAQGQGLDPATLRASLLADLTGAAMGGVRVDSVRVRAEAADGLATVRQAAVSLASAELQAEGSFGLRADRSGELRYQLRVDTLEQFSRFLPADSGAVAPRSAVQAAAIARARADSVRISRATEVSRIATGLPPEPTLNVDSVRPIPRDSLAGRLLATGRLLGNLQRFDALGELQARDFVFRGNSVRGLDARYSWLGATTPQGSLQLAASADSLSAAGFALDSLAANLSYRGDLSGRDAGGTLDLRVVQDSRRDYRVRSDFTLALDRKELRLADLALRFDTTSWRSTRPGRVAWGSAGIEVDTLELADQRGGRIFLDGRLPVEGAGDLRAQVRGLQIGDVLGMVQDSAPASGLLSLDATLRGTRRSPLLDGRIALADAAYQGRALPDLSAAFHYADASLGLDAALTRGGLSLATARGQVPVELALAGYTGDRLLRDRPLTLDVRADSIPLDALPSFTTAVEDVQGQVRGEVAVRGTLDDPALSGRAALDLGSFRLVPLGVTFRDIAGSLTLRGDSVRVDSLVAHSGGPIRIDGSVSMRPLTRPGFDLRLDSRGALVLDNDQGRIVTNARLAVQGPYEAVRVTGDVEVDHGVVYIPETGSGRLVSLDDPAVAQVVDTAAVSAHDVVPATNPLLAGLQVDVGVTIQHDTWVRSNEANVEIYTPEETGPLRVRMDRAENRLTLLGTVNTDRGQYTIMGRRLAITQGSVTFQGDTVLNPLVHVVAQSDVQLPGRAALQIQLHVGGSMRAPTLSLESNAQPPISQTDLLSYLAFGRSSTSLLQMQGSSLSGPSTGGGNLVGSVAGLATRQLASVAIGTLVEEFERDAARSLGLDEFRVTPADLTPEVSQSAFSSFVLGTEIEAGKYLTRRWFVAGQARPTLVRPGALLEYRTPRGFSWLATYQPRFLPQDPSFGTSQKPIVTGVFGSFLRWDLRF